VNAKFCYPDFLHLISCKYQASIISNMYSIAIHGGAGTILRSAMTAEMEKTYRQALSDALQKGFEILETGGSSLDAITTAIVSLEDNILFNAGRGSVFTNRGEHEMDASVMYGADGNAGAVAGVKQIRNPIVLAREVMEKSQHVFLCSEGAMEFALEKGLAMEPDEYFYSPFRFEQWQQVKDSDDYQMDHSVKPATKDEIEKKFGTVGAVACDQYGNLAAGTSTGGMTNKKFGRVGDSPIIGAGTYANNNTCAISCTGHGELFIKAVAAFDVHALMAYKKLSLEEAMREVVLEKLPAIGGEGGMIGVDKFGQAFGIFNSDGMYRGIKSSDGREEIAIYAD
jgi:beta-aspartyl-peptidase (threonine type)